MYVVPFLNTTVFQHTPSVQDHWWTEHHKNKGSDNVVSYDEGPELLTQFSLEGFTHVIPPHLRGGQILNIQVVLGHLIGQEENLIFKARVRLLELFLPLVSRRMALLLSW
jgi:hypothetical protein